MNVKLIIYFLILISAVEINADFSNIQAIENIQKIDEYSLQQEAIKLPWSDCIEIDKSFEKNSLFQKNK